MEVQDDQVYPFAFQVFENLRAKLLLVNAGTFVGERTDECIPEVRVGSDYEDLFRGVSLEGGGSGKGGREF
jgi:hypothetical protein